MRWTRWARPGNRIYFVPFAVGTIATVDILGYSKRVGPWAGYGNLWWSIPLTCVGLWLLWRADHKEFGERPVWSVMRHTMGNALVAGTALLFWELVGD